MKRMRADIRTLRIRDAGACVRVSGMHPRWRRAAIAYVMKASLKGMSNDEKAAYILDVFDVVARPATGSQGLGAGRAPADAGPDRALAASTFSSQVEDPDTLSSSEAVCLKRAAS